MNYFNTMEGFSIIKMHVYAERGRAIVLTYSASGNYPYATYMMNADGSTYSGNGHLRLSDALSDFDQRVKAL